METILHPSMYFDLAALVMDVLLCVFLILQYNYSEQAKSFFLMSVFLAGTCLFEVLRGIFGGFTEPHYWITIKNILYSVCYVSHTGFAFTSICYLSFISKKKFSASKPFQIANAVLFAAFIALMVVNFFTGWVCYVGPGPYQWIHGPLYLVATILPLYYMIGAVIIFLLHLNEYQRRMKGSIIISFLIILSGIILQPFMHSKITLTNFTSTVGIYLWFFAMENAGYNRLVEVTEALERAQQKAYDASLAKSAFLANMSHEIRTPMNAVLGLDEMILNSSDKTEIDKYARNIQASGKALLSIINNILDFSKIESGRMELVEENYHLAAILQDISLQVRMKASKQNLSFRMDVDRSIPDELFGDDLRIRQILTNLLNNAVKYSKPFGKVTLVVRGYANGETETLVFSVEDNGVGIKKEDLPNLFGSFQRMDEKRNRNIEGTGLGLAIVKHLVRLMDGTVDVQSEYGKGSTFTVSIPQKIVGSGTIADYKMNEEKKEEDSVVNRYRAPKAKVLVVDDNNLNLIVAEGFLKRTGASVTVCESGIECLELLKKERYDLIFLDHMMPEMDGVETLQRSQTMQENKNRFTPVIALTANAISGVRERYLAMGFTDYVSKPIDSHILYEVFFRNIAQNLVEEIVSPEKQESGTESSEEKKPSGNLIDTKKGLEFCGGDKEMYSMLLNGFADEFEENRGRLEKFLKDEDWKNYEILVHALKSNGKTLGTDSFSEKAKSLEFACKDIMAGNDINEKKSYIKSIHAGFISEYEDLSKEARACSGGI